MAARDKVTQVWVKTDYGTKKLVTLKPGQGREEVTDMTMKLTPEELENIRLDIREIMRAEGLTQTVVAKIAGCSPATISQILNGGYAGSPEEYLRRLSRWCKDREEVTTQKSVTLVRTTEAKRIQWAARQAWRGPCIAKIVLPAGYGKTIALSEFAASRGDQGMMIQVGEAHAGKRGILRAIAIGLGFAKEVRPTTQSAELYDMVAERLASKFVGGVPFTIVIDEATTLGAKALNVLRNLHDDPRVRCGIVLADTDRLEGELNRRGGIAGGYEQLRSRLGAVYAPVGHKPSKADVVSVAEAIIADISKKRKLTKAAANLLHDIACTPGAYRNVAFRLHAVRDFAADTGVEPTYSYAELDFVATLIGGKQEMTHTSNPFERTGVAGPKPLRKTAAG